MCYNHDIKNDKRGKNSGDINLGKHNFKSSLLFGEINEEDNIKEI